MLPGISTACLYPELTEKALKQLAKRGVAAANWKNLISGN